MSSDILIVENLEKKFLSRGRFLSSKIEYVNAVNGVSFKVPAGETFCLVGETGSGKTTIGKLVVRLLYPTKGTVYYNKQDIYKLEKKELMNFRNNVQMIFQDPYASLNPRQTLENIIGLPLKIHTNLSKEEIKDEVIELLNKVGILPAETMIYRNPHELSGGQRQRVGIARALALNPNVIVADEPVASLDVSIRAQVLNLMKDLKEEFNLTYLLIAHDLTVVNYMSDRIMIIYLGRPVEIATKEELFENPQHVYTKALIKAIPVPNPDVKIEDINLKGEIPSPINLPSGCTFHTRCPYAKSICLKEEPPLINIGNEHFVSCHLIT
jgi:oligopeptide/dipeptide ABC transporter ATP-binding protein